MNIEEYITKALRYLPDTGELYWTAEVPSKKMRNKRAGCLKKSGYVHIGCAGKTFRAHRVAWLLTHGEWPKRDIDHIDGDRANNRLSNLRDVKHSTNMQNLHGAQRNNKSGLLGASLHASSGRWQAIIGFDGKNKHIGLYDTALEAHQAYMKAKELRDRN